MLDEESRTAIGMLYSLVREERVTEGGGGEGNGVSGCHGSLLSGEGRMRGGLEG